MSHHAKTQVEYMTRVHMKELVPKPKVPQKDHLNKLGQAAVGEGRQEWEPGHDEE